MWKTYLFWLIGSLFLVSVCLAQSSETEFFYEPVPASTPSTSINEILKTDIVSAPDSFVKRILQVFNVDSFTTTNQSALSFATYLINIALSLVSFIAFIVVLYGFAQIIFSKDDEGISKAKQIIKWAAIAIIIIAISWLLVLFVNGLYERLTN